MSTLENNQQQVTTGNNTITTKEEINETVDEKKDGEKDATRKQHTVKRDIADTQVVDGLELSVECASDKDESSSESQDEKDVKPWPRTIIVKAEPNESELDCSSNEEKSDSQRSLVDTLEIKSEKSKENKSKRRGSRTNFSKLKVSGSEDSQNTDEDEDYSPRTKKKMKKSSLTTKKSINKHRSVESKRGRGKGTRKSCHKKNIEYTSDEEEDAHTTTVVEEADETTKTKNGMEKEPSEKESLSKDESDSNSERERKSVKDSRKRGHSNAVRTVEFTQ